MKKSNYRVSLLSLILMLIIILNLFLTVGCSNSEISVDSGEAEITYPPAFHVSPDGSDDADGSQSAPFCTIEKAQEAARASSQIKTVLIHEGTYMTEGLTMTSEDSGTVYSACGNDKVIINGGLILKGEDFTRPSDDFLDRLSEQTAKDQIYCVDLKNYGLTKEDWGNLHAIGTYNTAYNYSEDYVGTNCEVFVNDQRQTLARWPNEGYLELEGVTDEGGGQEKDAFGGIYNVGKEVVNRISKWQDFTSAWIFGCFRYNWSDSSSPLASFDTENNTITPLFASWCGVNPDSAVYYYYNVPEELDIPGEYYLDRENGILYLCLNTDPKDAEILFSYRIKNLIECESDNITFKGLTLLGICGNGIIGKGESIVLDSLTIKNIAGSAVSLSGSNNIVQNCDISHTGKGGIDISGGDRETLTPGNSLAYNNYIHDWSEIYITYQAGLSVSGVGNTLSHNELVNSPHMAIGLSGNDNIIEYNLVKDVCLLSDDAGALYCGRDWTCYGNVIRYNIFTGLGKDEHKPAGIYLDDGISGIEVYGNIVKTNGGCAYLIGGGRSNRIHDNIAISPNGRSLCYDQRARDGYFDDGWFSCDLLWGYLKNNTPYYQSELWAERYPELAKMKDTYETKDDPDFAPNPAHGEVYNNLFFSENPVDINQYVKTYGVVKKNKEYSTEEKRKWFTDANNNDFTFLKPEKMPDIPVSEIGREIEK